MHLSSTSAAGVRFLGSIREGHGLKSSAREAGINKEVVYRWLRESYLPLRREGRSPTEANAELGFTSSRFTAWEAGVEQVRDRDHLRVWCALRWWPAGRSGRLLRISSEMEGHAECVHGCFVQGFAPGGVGVDCVSEILEARSHLESQSEWCRELCNPSADAL